MIFSDTIIEGNKFFLRNLNTNEAGSTDWTAGSGSYGFYSVPYEIPLGAQHYYYVRYKYKFSTTNQKPTWVQFYSQDGSYTWSAGGSASGGLTVNNEYTFSNVAQPGSTGPLTLTYGTIYNGNSNAIAGVSASVKEVLVYDVTELFTFMQAHNNITTIANLKTWCDNNLNYTKPYINYDITNLINASLLNKISITSGNLINDTIIEPDGMKAFSYSDTLRNNTYFDTGLPFSIYNNAGGGTVTLTRISAADQSSPFYPEHQYICKITTNGTAAPGAGGFYAQHTAAANKIFVEKFVAKIPTGYSVYAAYNGQGTGASVTFISPQAGTGKWEEYTILYKCGSSGSFSTGGHVYISGSNNTSVTWYVAYVNNCDITNNEYLKNYSVLGNIDRIKSGAVFSRTFDTQNLLPMGNGYSQISSLFSNSNWTYDTTDVAGNAIASIVQPVGAGAGNFGPRIPIVPGRRYKLSYWVKCKRDMSSFLTAIRIFVNNTELTHANVHYKSGTKTQLTAALNPGDTQMTVKSNANWGTYSYSRLGFRSNSSISYNDLGLSNGYNNSTGLIQGIEGSTIVKFNTAYTGTAQPVNRYVTEAYDGGTYPYPISKNQLPSDNTWTYVEGYFGANDLWDGNSASGQWHNIPFNANYIQLYLNIYSNNGTVPIKFSDIRIEPISTGVLSRVENKLQIIGGN